MMVTKSIYYFFTEMNEKALLLGKKENLII